MHRSIKTILDRRAILTGAAAAPLAVATAAPAAAAASESPYSTAAVTQRVNDFAKQMEVPAVAVESDTDGVAILSDSLVAWCTAHGASLDWIATADNRSMLRAYKSLALPGQSSSDPLPHMVSDWFRCLKIYQEIGDLVDAEYDKTGDISAQSAAAQDEAYDIYTDKGRAICATPATTQEGLAFQLAYFVTDFGEEFVEGHGNGFDKIIPSFRAGLENTLKETCGEISR